MLAALNQDRYWHDGRLRNGYLAVPVGAGPVKLAGWWDDKQNMWVEDRYQVGSDSGNMAWAILALLALDQSTGDHRYRDGAARIGSWVTQWRSKNGPGGFSGGAFAHEPVPETWKSTEHNTDLTAAFTSLWQATGNKNWLEQARAAQEFVAAMWTPSCGCFAVGTGEDGITHNPYLALDAQVWPLLAIPGAAALLWSDCLGDSGKSTAGRRRLRLQRSQGRPVDRGHRSGCAFYGIVGTKSRSAEVAAGHRRHANGRWLLLRIKHEGAADGLHVGDRSRPAAPIFSYRSSGGAFLGRNRQPPLQSVYAKKQPALVAMPGCDSIAKSDSPG
jgi:hypothetical protein